MPDTPNRKDLFEHWSGSYDQAVNREGFPLIGYRQVLDTIIAQADFQHHHRVLDMGVGTGNLAKRVPLPQNQIWGVDFASSMLDKAVAELPDANLLQVDLLDPRWPPELEQPFDRIISAYTLHEFPDEIKQNMLLRLAAKTLGVGGLIIVGDISFKDRKRFKEGHANYKGLWDEEEYYWCAQPMTKRLIAVGFSVKYTQISKCAGVYVLKFHAGLEAG